MRTHKPCFWCDKKRFLVGAVSEEFQRLVKIKWEPKSS
jgi:hypothetical protein